MVTFGAIPAAEPDIRGVVVRALTRTMRSQTKEDREDTEQEAMTRLYRVRTEIDEQHWQNYVYATAVSAANDFKRRSAKRVSTVGLEVVVETVAAPPTVTTWDLDALESSIAQPRDAERFRLFVDLAEQGFNQADIASRLGMSHSTFRTWKWRLVKKLERWVG